MKPRHPRRAPAAKNGVPKLSEVIPELIRLDEERFDYVFNELPKLYADWPLVGPGEDPEPSIPQKAQILELLEKLPADMVYQLLLIEQLSLDIITAFRTCPSYTKRSRRTSASRNGQVLPAGTRITRC